MYLASFYEQVAKDKTGVLQLKSWALTSTHCGNQNTSFLLTT